MHTHTCIHSRIESDFKKPGAPQPQACFKNPPYCTSFDLNKRLTSFLYKAIDQQVFSSSFKQRTRIRMRICTHGWQTGDKEIDQTATFWHHLFHKTLVQH